MSTARRQKSQIEQPIAAATTEVDKLTELRQFESADKIRRETEAKERCEAICRELRVQIVPVLQFYGNVPTAYTMYTSVPKDGQ